MDGNMVETDMAGMETEPGATDNELTLSVGDYPFTKTWEDGESYTLTVEVTQVSPGRFRVDTAAPKEAAEGEEGPAPEEEAGYEQPTNSGSYPNPAIQRMMAKR